MKRIIIFALFLLCSVVATAQPQINFERLNHNFGTLIYRGEAQSVTLPFTNTGDKPLVLIRSRVECSCISVTLPTKPVKAGERGEIVITYNPNKDLGEFHKGVEIISNAAVSPRVILFVEGDVIRKRR